jgi:DNA-binding response OmpR family regulator
MDQSSGGARSRELAAMFTPVIRVGALEVDILHRRVRLDGHDLHLTPLELSLLYLLAANAERVVTRAMSSTARSASSGQNSRTIGVVPGTSPRCPA